MTLIATLFRDNIELLQDNLNINMNNFAIVKGNDLLHKELCFLVYDQKNINSTWTDQVIGLIKSIGEDDCTIIYCA